MKLNHKLTLYFTLSKLIIFGVFVSSLPSLFDWYSVYTIDKFLQIQREKVFQDIKENGLDFYLEGQDSYGSYTMLKEDYVSIQKVPPEAWIDSSEIDDQIRIIGSDTIPYRILKNVFTSKEDYYLLEIGRSQQTINLYSDLLQQVSLFFLIVLTLITLLLDFFYLRKLLKPFRSIVAKRLINQKFPFNINFVPIKTTTRDFRFLDDSLQELMVNVNSAFKREREFTANASHELLTPVSILKNKIENMTMDDNLLPEQLDRLMDMSRTLDRLGKIIKALLFLARIDGGQYKKEDEFHPKAILYNVFEELTPMLEEMDIRYTIRVNVDIVFKHMNKELFFHMLYNIVSNAIRYNVQHGQIIIHDEYKDGYYCLHIKDTGIGITPARLPSLFNRFSSKGGTGRYGLGLSIVKSIADAFDIEITVDSTPGTGTTYSLTFNKKTFLMP
ncbi:HAMP domain-containing histidine kinase [Sphingobacterium olei]|uniref:histidine kinase n=1 Tax=Sphingobacterium olei TaxID=2571155 RepID=A0A4U0NZ15_9SPHI|nr:HAMP domain-containing sensor histidine kinase [Sphingobacterium olei]TJZ59960.1 HAMP domain-containing histidine kinase [Sphingobacterium olei]